MPTRAELLPNPVRARSLVPLNQLLAAAIDLHGQVKHACWNLRGTGCVAAYGPLDRVSAAIEHMSDLIAFHLAELGGSAEGTVQTAARRSFLARYPLGTSAVGPHVQAVLHALAAFVRAVRQVGVRATGFGDVATATLLAEIALGIDRQVTDVGRLAAMRQHTSCCAPVPFSDSANRDSANRVAPPAVPWHRPTRRPDGHCIDDESPNPMSAAIIAATTYAEING